MRARTTALTATAALIAGLGTTAYATPPTPAPTTAPARPLAGMRILISNDDSMQAAKASNSDGLGLYELRRAICAAGADVVVMAPWQVQSGRGTAVTNGGVLHVRQRTELPAAYRGDCSGAPSGGKVFGVCLADGPCGPDTPSATPADTVKLALRGGLAAKAGWTEGPDLVLTGINSGWNVSASVNDSGTVGAAVAAIDAGVPAVAFSSSGDRDFASFPLVNYRAHAEFGARFVAGLKEEGLLTDEFAVKVDYPDVSEGQRARPPVWTRVGDGAVAFHAYEQQGAGDAFRIVLGLCDGTGECAETRRDADSTWVQRGHITVAPLTWDRTYGTSVEGRRELKRLERYVEGGAPRS
ncbi:5'/3'-nucleotidase SurE [Streptomyces sp. NPDC086023]|uniref:5'/3'-nucleotidase SurE n=1 Tax=Streptomyces sp. NPDC086023 TaxID=3365746 RepID=UPI0037CF6E4B